MLSQRGRVPGGGERTENRGGGEHGLDFGVAKEPIRAPELVGEVVPTRGNENMMCGRGREKRAVGSRGSDAPAHVELPGSIVALIRGDETRGVHQRTSLHNQSGIDGVRQRARELDALEHFVAERFFAFLIAPRVRLA